MLFLICRHTSVVLYVICRVQHTLSIHYFIIASADFSASFCLLPIAVRCCLLADWGWLHAPVGASLRSPTADKVVVMPLLAEIPYTIYWPSFLCSLCVPILLLSIVMLHIHISELFGLFGVAWSVCTHSFGSHHGTATWQWSDQAAAGSRTIGRHGDNSARSGRLGALHECHLLHLVMT